LGCFLLLAVVGGATLTQRDFTNWISVLVSMASLTAQSDALEHTEGLCFRKESRLTGDIPSSSKNVPKTFHTWETVSWGIFG
jgi:hypothetical protein